MSPDNKEYIRKEWKKPIVEILYGNTTAGGLNNNPENDTGAYS